MVVRPRIEKEHDARTQEERPRSASATQRRSQQKLSVETASFCPQCKSPKLPHRACPKCGTYKGREVIVLDVEKKK